MTDLKVVGIITPDDAGKTVDINYKEYGREMVDGLLVKTIRFEVHY